MKSLILVGLVTLVCSKAFALISLPYILQNEFQVSVGANPCFSVQQMHEPETSGARYKMIVRACDKDSGQALTDVMQSSYPDYFVDVEIVDSQGTVLVPSPSANPTLEQVVTELDKAFLQTGLYTKAYRFCAMGPDCNNLIVEIKPIVLRVFFDDIGMPDGRHSFLAADLYEKFLRPQVGNVALRPFTGH